jgi:site-specific DNA recombinase
MAKQRALIYCRVSKDQRKGRSVSEQERECREICDENGWNVVEVIIDNDRSASSFAKKGRPGWLRVRSLLADRAADVLVVWELSRATRDMDEAVALRDACKKNGVRLNWQGETYNLMKAGDAKRFIDDANDAEYEAGRTSERIKRSTRAQASKGKPHGRRLFGYDRVYEEKELVGQVINKAEAQVILEAAKRVLAGDSLGAISRDFTSRSIFTSTGAKWEATTLKRSLTNPTYNAKRVHRYTGPQGEQIEEMHDGDWPAILNDDLFGRLSAFLMDPARRLSRTVERAHLLPGIARCGECGARMKWWRDRDRGVYCCAVAYHNTIGEESLDAFIEAIVLARLSGGELGEMIEDETPATEVVAARSVIATLQARLDDATAQFVAGELSGAMLAKIEQAITAERVDAERAVKYSGIPASARNLIEAQNPERVWARFSIKEKADVIRALMSVTVHRSTRPKGSKGFDPNRVSVDWHTD